MKNRTNIWPALQFNFEWTFSRTRALTTADEEAIRAKVPFNGGGLVHMQFMPSRLIVTCTAEDWALSKYKENLLEVLLERKIVPEGFEFDPVIDER